MATKYGVGPISTSWPAEVTLTSNRQPEAKACSAISTANGAPTAQPTMPTRVPFRSNSIISVW